jgi:hypothetical protein
MAREEGGHEWYQSIGLVILKISVDVFTTLDLETLKN